MPNLKRLVDYTVFLPAGMAEWLALCAARGPYAGSREFYRRALADSNAATSKIARGFLDLGFLRQLFVDYEFQRNNQGPEPAPVGYVDESLAGYGDPDYEVGGAERIEDQQRGLMLPMVRDCLAELAPGALVIEIGSGNGDVTALLAHEFPSLRFVGLDFFVSNAEKKHGAAGNLTFLSGYPLNTLKKFVDERDRGGEIVVYASSTLVLCTPMELYLYMAAFAGLRVRHVLISDPCFGGYEQRDERPADGRDLFNSKHMEGPMWFHDYCGHLRCVGFDIERCECFPYKNPKSLRPDLHVGLVWGRAD